MISIKRNKEYISFQKRLLISFKGVLIFILILMFISFLFGKGLWVILAVVVIKLPTSIKRSRFHIIRIEEYNSHLRLLYMDYCNLKTKLIKKSELKITLSQLQSRDIGFYLNISINNKKLLRISDSAGWTLIDFLLILKSINGKIPGNWFLKEKPVKEYMRSRHPKVDFDWGEVVENNS